MMRKGAAAFIVLVADGANVLILAAFLVASVRLLSSAYAHIRSAVELIDVPWTTLVAHILDPGIVGRLQDLAWAWLLGTAGAGCLWMTILGIRWLHLAILRHLRP